MLFDLNVCDELNAWCELAIIRMEVFTSFKLPACCVFRVPFLHCVVFCAKTKSCKKQRAPSAYRVVSCRLTQYATRNTYHAIIHTKSLINVFPKVVEFKVSEVQTGGLSFAKRNRIECK
jgi:hypothetical protein